MGPVNDSQGEERGFSRMMLRNHAVDVAPNLLGMVIANDDKYLVISEVEAYGGAEDEASHAFRGKSRRNKSMFADAGTLYVYLSYGIHKCINVVTADIGTGEAVLIRSGVSMVISAENEMSSKVVRGPGRVGQWLNASLGDDGRDLLSDRHWQLIDVPSEVAKLKREFIISTRIGISKAIEMEWRFEIDSLRLAEQLRGSKVI